MNLPRLEFQPAPRQSLEYLNQWLAEWEWAQSLDTGPDERAAPLSGLPQVRGLPAEDDRPLGAGQIRLLRPSSFRRSRAAFDSPRFFAVLAGGAQAAHEAVPFSPFSVPALPRELLLLERAAGVRVLCFWNACPVPDRLAEMSWFVDDLSAAESAAAGAVRAGKYAGQGGRRCTGPPCWHPGDPRHVYCRREAGTWQALFREARAGLDGLPRAAEGPPPYGGLPRGG